MKINLFFYVIPFEPWAFSCLGFKYVRESNAQIFECYCIWLGNSKYNQLRRRSEQSLGLRFTKV